MTPSPSHLRCLGIEPGDDIQDFIPMNAINDFTDALETHIMQLQPSQVYEFNYINHAGEDELRRVIFHSFEYGIIKPYYPTPTWMIRCYDLDRRSFRSFDITKVKGLRYDGKRPTFKEDQA